MTNKLDLIIKMLDKQSEDNKIDFKLIREHLATLNGKVVSHEKFINISLGALKVIGVLSILAGLVISALALIF